MHISQQQLLTQLAALNTLPRPLLGQVVSLPNHAIGTPHRHPWAQLSYALKGVVTVNTQDGQFVAPPTRAVLIPPGIEHGVHCPPATVIRSLYISAEQLTWQHCQVLEIDPLLRELIVAFSLFPVEYDQHGSEGRLVAVLLDRLAQAKVSDLMLPWPQDPRLSELCHYLAQHADCRLPLSHFSTQLQISEKTLSRAFKQDTGLSFRHWRQRSRLLAALPLLEAGERVTDVALACGYDSLSAFIAAFKSLLGRSPGDYLNV
ncbi:AraC family transcriptional regulator [Oceanisphaera avium]|uniref:AraC family transcriptional regulator n=1 Tax=Oceanisphaera avium TaxID=1903694 RepID=A0A1Y0D1T5_9GAMM|nr:helix-turn-helix transcriptional regulator [Oceanisphaera avium]ART81065.1 AraC family transcriptional regulator [Oceanisphaera avium]